MTTSAVNAEMSFEDAMSSVASIFSTAGMSFGKLSTKAEQMGMNTKYTATELFPSCRAEPRRRDGWSNIRSLA